VPEAQNELAQTARTVMIGLMVCDARQALALEITATSLVARSPLKGLLAMTNHFRSPGLATLTECPRYDAMTCDTPPALDLDEMASRLHAANQGSLTLQTMVFVPAARELHLSLGTPPTTRGPLRCLDLTPLFAGE
jgi:hypothetical protein